MTEHIEQFYALFLVLVGGCIAYIPIHLQNIRQNKQERDNLRKLASLLRQEVAAIRDLLENRMDMNGKFTSFDLAFPDSASDNEVCQQATDALPSLLTNSYLFNAYLDKILNLRGIIPLSLAKFDGELQVVYKQLLEQRGSNDIHTWEKLRITMIEQARELEAELSQVSQHLQRP